MRYYRLQQVSICCNAAIRPFHSLFYWSFLPPHTGYTLPVTWPYGSYLAFFLILSAIVFRQVIFSARINTESVCAALSGFLLIGDMGFFMFSAIENYTPGAFRGLSHDELQMMNELFYYSFISILTVGYGDIVAVSWPARNATILVILTGYIYSLVFIARIVSGLSVSDK